MRKIIVLMILSVSFSVLLGINCYAQTNISEKPEIKLVINNTPVAMQNYAIVADNYTLLPVREILNNLGVKNDQITWDGSNKTITIRASIEIYLKIDSYEALVNGVSTKLSVPPIVYNNKTYIPLRFISEVLAKKIVWDSNSSTIYIKNISEYNKVKEIYNLTAKNMSTIKNYKRTDLISISSNENNISTKIDMTMNSQIDIEHNLLSGNLDCKSTNKTENFNALIYCDGSKIYINPNGQMWVSKPLTDATKSSLYSNGLSATDQLYCSLKVDDTTYSDKIILEGYINFNSFIQQISSSNESAFGNVKIVIDKQSMLITQSAITASDDSTSSSITISSSYGEYNGNMIILPPSDLNTNSLDFPTESLSYYQKHN
jgi:hypothetical protein